MGWVWHSPHWTCSTCLCGLKLSAKVLPWDTVQYHTGRAARVHVYLHRILYTCKMSAYEWPHYKHGCHWICTLCLLCNFTAALSRVGGVCVFSVLYNLSIWSGMFTSLGIPVPFVIISVAARSSLYRIPKSYDTTSPLYSEIRAWVLPRSTPLLLLVWHLYTQTCSLVSQTSFSFAN